MSYTSDNISKTVYPVLDMMMNMQRLGLRALSIYQPLTSAFLDSTVAAQRGAGSGFFGSARGRSSELRDVRNTNEEQVIGVGEEVLTSGPVWCPAKRRGCVAWLLRTLCSKTSRFTPRRDPGTSQADHQERR